MVDTSEFENVYKTFIGSMSGALADGAYQITDDEINSGIDCFQQGNAIRPAQFRTWIKYYHSNRLLTPIIIELLLSSDGEDDCTMNLLLKFLDQAINLAGISWETLVENLFGNSPAIKYYFYTSLKKNLDLDIEALNKGVQPDRPIIDSTAYLFVSSVLFPCILHFGKLPQFLYRKARLGDIDSMCNLLRLDKGVMFDPRIMSHVKIASLRHGSDDFNQLCNAFKGGPPKITTKKLKTIVAAYIFKAFKASGLNITSTDIQALMDSAHSEFNPGEMIDSDLPETPHGYYVGISRKASKMNIFSESHKK